MHPSSQAILATAAGRTPIDLHADSSVSLVRLYALRALYLLFSVGLALVVWPGVIHHDKPWSFWEGATQCMLVAFSLLCALGLKYPLRMLPVLLWELLWKSTWYLIVALPMWRAGTLDAITMANVFNCAFAVLIPIVLPWGYVLDRYVRSPGDRWK